jgi:hypothetical protein
MGRKYIGQQTDYNFVYPNFDPAIYDVEIVHDINDNSVSGTVSTISATTVSSTGITISFNWTWSKNGAEPYINNTLNRINLLSVHMLGPTQLYYKPWRMVDYVYSGTTTGTTYSGTTSISVTPSQLGLTSFTNGNYQFEIRFIGKRAIYPICQTLTISSIVAPTPTPTPTPSVTPTIPVTPTPSPTPVNAYTTGATLNVTDSGWIKYTMASGSTYQFIASTGIITLTNCLDCSTIMVGIPFADLANFTILGCGSSCTPISPTPTPTPTGSTATLAWSFTEGNGADGYMDLYVNGSVIESRSNTSNGTYTVNVGDTINVQVFCDTCSEPNTYSNAYCIGIINDAACANNTSSSIFTSIYTVVSGDVGTTLNLATYAVCDSGCV